ncbi:MAG TPA: CRISPR system precrRNA processing endoribonuclease RAMP protein Cas6 [Desulfobacterales bacterium]|nr:CRISPR system precrRNA processing endoribonuclease RAMP protein Cas6 [Desulfobacterales bacterium]
MLTAIILELQPINDAKLPLSHGVFSYAAALSLLERIEPDLPRRLHDSASSKPLTTSPVWGGFRDGTLFRLQRGKTYRWRLTGLDEAVSTCLSYTEAGVGNVRIGDTIFCINRVLSEPQEDPEVGKTTYESLWSHWQNISPPVRFPVQFHTPTTFRRGHVEDPFPAPHLVFGSLVNSWNTHSPQSLGEITDVLREMVILTNWKGETRRVELGSRRTVGFVGKFTYSVIENLPEICRVLGLLLDYAFYAGVGWQTTHGLGQTRLAYKVKE